MGSEMCIRDRSLIIGAVLNIILDPIFITVLKPYGLGIEAAAYATVFSQFVQAVITLWYFRKKSPNVKIGRIRIDGELLPQVLSVGVSALLMQILTLVQQTVIYRVAANYGGENSQILLGAALRFWNFSFVPLWGISQGFQPAAGTNYGAKEYDRVKTLTRVFIVAATILSLVFYIPVNKLTPKLGKKKMILFAFAVFSLAYFYTGFMGKMIFIPATVQGLILTVVAALPMAIFGILPQAVVADIAQSDSIRTGSNREGMFYAARTFAFKLGQSLSMLIFTAVSTIGAGDGTGYRVAAFGAAVFCCIGGIILVFYNEKKINGIIGGQR